MKAETSFPAIYLLHGKGGSPDGSVSKLEPLLRAAIPELHYLRPRLPHSDPQVAAEESVKFLAEAGLPKGALLIGISLGGLVAAKLQETGRPDLHVICVSSPTWADEVELQHRAEHRVALYSSLDEVIAGGTSQWPELAESYDLPWLTHDTDVHLPRLVPLIIAWIRGENIAETRTE